MALLADQFAPTTWCIGLLEAPFEVVVEADKSWRQSIGGYDFSSKTGTLAELLLSIEPLSGPLLRYVWIETKSPWVAYFDNFVNGSDPFGPVSYLSESIGCRGLLVSMHRDIPGKSYGQRRFDLYGQHPVGDLNVTRSVAVTHEAKWDWDSYGAPLDFEVVERYKNRRIADRLTPLMVTQYAKHLGADVCNVSFYGDRGCLVENSSIDTKICRFESFDAARQRLGL